LDNKEFHMTPTPWPTQMTAWLEQAWLARYLDRQLADDETTWFEAYVLDKPELLATIEADTRLRDALAADATARYTDRFIGAESPATPSTEQDNAGAANDEQPTGDAPIDASPPSGARRAGAPAAWLALAASLLLGFGIGGIGTRALAPGSTAPEIVANPTRIIYDTMRGEAAPPRVEHAGSKSPYVLIEVAVPPGAEDIALKIGIEPERTLTASPDGFVGFLLSRTELRTAREAQIAYRSGTSARTQKIDLPLSD
jgi:hypothetical protein